MLFKIFKFVSVDISSVTQEQVSGFVESLLHVWYIECANKGAESETNLFVTPQSSIINNFLLSKSLLTSLCLNGRRHLAYTL